MFSKIIGEESCNINGSHVIGIRKNTLVISQTKKHDFFCTRFRLGGTYSFFKIPAYFFSTGFYSLEELFDYEFRYIEEELYEIKDNRKRIELIWRIVCRNRTIYKYRFVSTFVMEIKIYQRSLL